MYSSPTEQVFVDGRLSSSWRTAAVVLLAFLFAPGTLLSTTFGTLAVGLAAETGWNHSSVAYGASLISLTLIFVAPAQGYLVDRLGARAVVLISIPLFAAVLMLFRVMTVQIGYFYLGCIIATVAAFGVWPASYMKILASWFSRRLGIIIGLTTSGISITTFLLPIITSWSFKNIGWSNTYFIIGMAMLCVIWPILYFKLHSAPPLDKVQSSATKSTRQGGLFPRALNSRAFWIGVFTFFAFGLANAAILVHGIQIMHLKGVALSTAIQAQSIIGIGLFFGRLGTGWLLDRTSVRIVLVIMLIMLLAALMIYVLPIHADATFLAVALGGMVVGAEFDVLGVLVRRHFPQTFYGRVYSFVFAAFNLGGAVGASVFALMSAKAASYDRPLLYLIGLCCVALAYVMSLQADGPGSARPSPA